MIIEIVYPEHHVIRVQYPEQRKNRYLTGSSVLWSIKNENQEISFEVPLQDEEVYFSDEEETKSMYNVLDFKARLNHHDKIDFNKATIIVS
jgi:hypothetical protein